jgi:HK97 family phage prohead protease
MSKNDQLVAAEETRSCPVAELRVAGADQGTAIEGYAAVFNRDSEPLGGFVERIQPGAFRRTLAEGADVRALIDHDPSRIIGRRKAGTLEVREDPHGLKVSIKPPDTTAGRDLVASIRRGDVDQMSFGFRAVRDEWEERSDGMTQRTLVDVDLFDISAVTFPAYPDTEIAVRSLERWRDRETELRRRIDMARDYLKTTNSGETEHGRHRDHDRGAARAAGRAAR